MKTLSRQRGGPKSAETRTSAQVGTSICVWPHRVPGGFFASSHVISCDFDAGSIPEFQRNQFGGSLGGPVRTNKRVARGNSKAFCP